MIGWEIVPILNPMENLFNILNEKVYCDPELQTLDELKKKNQKGMTEHHYWLSQILFAQNAETPRISHC